MNECGILVKKESQMKQKMQNVGAVFCVSFLLSVGGSFVIDMIKWAYHAEISMKSAWYIIQQYYLSGYPFGIIVFLFSVIGATVGVCRRTISKKALGAAFCIAGGLHLSVYLFVGRVRKSIAEICGILLIYLLPLAVIMLLSSYRKKGRKK